MSAEKINLSRQEIFEQIRLLLESWASDPDVIDKINEKTNLIADLGLDSIGILQTILAVEKEFDISIEDQELDSQVFSEMGNFVNFLAKKIYEDN